MKVIKDIAKVSAGWYPGWKIGQHYQCIIDAVIKVPKKEIFMYH